MKVKVELTTEQIGFIIEEVFASLDGDTYNTHGSDDPRKVIEMWREQSPNYVKRRLKVWPESSREEAEDNRRAHDLEADLLEVLLPHVESNMEVASA